jgi:hypothetical protein
MEREDSSTVQAADAKFGTSRGFIIDPTVGAEAEENSSKAPAEPRRRKAGQLADPIQGSAKGQKF